MRKKVLACTAAIVCFLSAATACVQDGLETFALEKERITMYVGEEKILRASDGGELDAAFLSTAPETVSVDDSGRIRALAVGAGIIVVRSGKDSAVCTVIVTGEAPVNIESLKITGACENLTAGDSVRLEYSKTPLDADNYNSIRWSSSAPNIASVDADGLLTALSPGKALITLRATGTDFEDSFQLNVAARPNRLALNYDDVTGLVGSSDLILEAELFTDYKDVEPGEWTTDDAAVATVDNGKISFVGAGKTTLRYVVTAGGERLEATCSIAAVEKPGYTVIRTPEQLQDIGNTSGNYMLGNDIDLEEACSKGGSLYHGGAGFSPLFSDAGNAFKGIFDGMGYTISNLRIESSNAFTALFSYVSSVAGKEGIIRNLSLDGGSVTGGHYSAALVGRCNSTDGSAFAAIENCFVRVKVSSFGLSAGLIGFNGGVIRNCISLCSLSGETTAAFTLRQCDNAAIGVKDSFSLQGSADCLVPEGKNFSAFMEGKALSEEKLKTASTYASWDKNIWNIAEGSFPSLRTPNER